MGQTQRANRTQVMSTRAQHVSSSRLIEYVYAPCWREKGAPQGGHLHHLRQAEAGRLLQEEAEEQDLQRDLARHWGPRGGPQGTD